MSVSSKRRMKIFYCILLFDCQNLISAPPRSNALPSAPATRAANFWSALPDRLGDLARRACNASANHQDESAEFRFNDQREDQRVKPPPRHRPSCAQAMCVARKTRRFNGLPDLYVFECRPCRISHTEESTPPDESNSKQELALGIWTSSATRHAKSNDATSDYGGSR